MLKLMKKYFDDFLSLFFPQHCAVCKQSLINQEKIICSSCLYKLPRTNFHKTPENSVEKSFWGRVFIEQGTSYFFFRKGSNYQKLLHKLKYQNQPQIGFELGKYFASEIVKEGFFKDIDYIVPVPLHKKKLKKRGYNQSAEIAKGMSKFLGGKLSEQLLKRSSFTDTQTKKNRFDRWENVAEVFVCKTPELIENKHILLVDDVLTTGATIEGCVQAFKKVAQVKVSIATLAFAGE